MGKVLLRVNTLFQGNYSAQIVVQSLDAKHGGEVKTESTYGGV
ncbi:hypothetical protein [Desulfosporosinus sp. FKB]|nr:hypothetical protein [Desulfosporosinus sp. FKB]